MFRNIRQIDEVQRSLGLPDFLQIFHPIRPQDIKKKEVKSEPIKQYHPDKWLEDIIKNYNTTEIASRDHCNRNAIIQSDEEIRQSQEFENLVDHRQECQAIVDQLMYEPLNQRNHKYFNSLVQKYFTLLSQVKDLKQVQVLINLFPCKFQHVQTSVHNIQSHLVKALIFQKYKQYDHSYENLLNHINESFFSVRSIISSIKKSNIESSQSQFTLSSNLKELFLKLLRVCQFDYWKNRKPNNYMNLLKESQAFVLFSFNNEVLFEKDDTIIDFMLIVMKKICQNLNPVVIFIYFFVLKSVQLEQQVFKTFFLEFVKHCRFYEKFFCIALESFHIDQKRLFLLKNKITRKGIAVRKNCNFCHQSLNEETSVIVYGCGHRFHSYCDNHEAYCEECSYISDARLCNFLLKLVEKFIFDRQNEIGPQIIALPNKNKIKHRQAKENHQQKQQHEKRQKIISLNRKFKMFDYEIYIQQKTALNPLKLWDSPIIH